MDIGTIIAGLNAIASLMNQPTELTPAQAEEKKPRAQQPSGFVVLPNQTPPMGIVPPMGAMPAVSYWNQLPPANVLRSPLWRMPQMGFGTPVFRGVPLTTYFPNFYEPSLEELYQLYFGTRF